jgi:metal-responsive CopG/Arc/MetJ family transcriptional regulator
MTLGLKPALLKVLPMPKRLDEDAQRIHLLVPNRDIERIDRLFANPANPGARHMKRSEAIRTIISKFLDQVEARAQQKAQSLSSIKVDVDL